MALSPKNKKTLTIISISIGVLLVLLAIFFTINIRKGIDEQYPVGFDMVSMSSEIGSYEKSESIRTPELDSSNYYEANLDSKIKKSGSVDLKVENLEESYDTIREIMSGYQATVVSSYDTGEGNEKSISTTIKVKSENFEDIYEDVKQMGGEVLYASYYTDDVTMEYTDLESRLRNLTSTETQLVKILDTAKTVEDTLAVYKELTQIRSQIEVIEGQLKYLDSQVDYSYLTVNLSLSDLGRDVRDEEWKPLGVVKNAFGSLVDFGIYIADILIWLIIFSPIIAIIVVTVVLIRRKAKKSK